MSSPVSRWLPWLAPPLVIFGIGPVLFFIAARFQILPQIAIVGRGFAVAGWLFLLIGLVWTLIRLFKGPQDR